MARIYTPASQTRPDIAAQSAEYARQAAERQRIAENAAATDEQSQAGATAPDVGVAGATTTDDALLGVEDTTTDDALLGVEDTTTAVDETAQDSAGDELSWIDDLTLFDGGQDSSEVEQVDSPVEPEYAEQTDAGYVPNGDDFEYVDAEVVGELHSKLLAPELEKLNQEIAKLRAAQEQQEQNKQLTLRAQTNKAILTAVPKADKILASREFMEYVDATADPYSTDTPMERLTRAYNTGDSAYVLQRIEAFINSRKKPKPGVSAEPVTGVVSGQVEQPKQKPMTEAEYKRKRAEIMREPYSMQKLMKLKALAEQYDESREVGKQ